MLCIHLKNTNPYFCLAAEEYLLKNFDEDIFMLWQSNDTVVLGKHQNALGEINYPFVREKKITVARRISGGGTVFHDAGNVNFSFIKNVKSPAEISFSDFTMPVVETLARLEIEATTSGRNDLLIEGLKISGNAEHIYKNRVLHHGTLLFNSNLENLGLAIKVIPGKYIGKAVQSHRSPVANISSFLKDEMQIQQFIQFMIDVQLEKNGNAVYAFSDKDSEFVKNQVNEKFSTWEWNFGYSPKYSFNNEVEIDGKNLKIQLAVKKGIIETCTIEGDYFSGSEGKQISALLYGGCHSYETVEAVLNTKRVEIIHAFF